MYNMDLLPVRLYMCKSSVLLFVAHRQYTFSALSYQGQHQQEREPERERT